MTHQLFSNHLAISIHALGAELCSVKNKAGLEFIWQANKAVWARHAPVLFPFVGKLKADTYVFDDKKYQVSQHGFARDMVFDLINVSNTSITFQLKQNNQTLLNFPFDFTLEIKYTLQNNELTVAYRVTNPSNQKIFFSIGAHPGFKIPLQENEAFEDYSLAFSGIDLQKTKLENGLISNTQKPLNIQNNLLPLSANLFDEDALVFENSQINQISLFSTKSAHKITLSCKNWPFFGIWSKKGCQEFVCLEPWYGIADSIDSTQQLIEKKGIICLNPQKTFECSYTIAFD